jgi:hypothetical protein
MDMGKKNVVVSDELWERFRGAVYKRKGLRKGDLSKAVAEALELWMTEVVEDVNEKPIA